MKPSQAIRTKLELKGIEYANLDESKLIIAFEDDWLFYKSILKELFKKKIQDEFGDELDDDSVVDDFFTKRTRYFKLRELENKMNVKFPRLEMSQKGCILTLLVTICPTILVFAYWLVTSEFKFFPDFFVIGFYSLIATGVVWAIFILGSTFNFSYLDWPRVKTFSDLLNEMAVDNFIRYQENTYRLTLDELKSIRNNESSVRSA